MRRLLYKRERRKGRLKKNEKEKIRKTGTTDTPQNPTSLTPSARPRPNAHQPRRRNALHGDKGPTL